jgi:site-specific DNA-methyltransferase (cytosine-N4-specific)
MFIQLFAQEGETILDPFAGCGTTLVEAMLLNRKAIGVDMNPLACLISKTKTTLVRQRDLDRLWAIVVQMQSIFGLREDADVEYLTQIGTFNDTDMKFPKRKISDLFTPDVMAELRTIKERIEELKDNETLFNLALVALSATIRVVIESERRNGFYHTFRQKVKMMIAVLEELNRQIHQSNVTVLHSDARQVPISDASVDLVVTSPPYVNALDYYRVHQYNMAWLGMDYKAFQKQEIGGHSHFISNRFRLLSEYLGDMLRAMIEMSRVLKPNSVCAIVIGNSSLEYELIESHKFFAAMAPDAGFELKKLLFRNIDVTRKYHNQEVGKINNEHIIVLQKVTNPPVAATADDFIADIVQREMLKFKKQVDKNPGSSLHGKQVSAARLNRNPERLMAAIATVQKDIKFEDED